MKAKTFFIFKKVTTTAKSA